MIPLGHQRPLQPPARPLKARRSGVEHNTQVADLEILRFSKFPLRSSWGLEIDLADPVLLLSSRSSRRLRWPLASQMCWANVARCPQLHRVTYQSVQEGLSIRRPSEAVCHKKSGTSGGFQIIKKKQIYIIIIFLLVTSAVVTAMVPVLV